ncbi:hypothetical protein CCASP_01745 [Corynebacterium caspium DSM 44850]|nr:hypothetical protein CCASP_01745 [Corynebacterium caspium DSM 44850]
MVVGAIVVIVAIAIAFIIFNGRANRTDYIGQWESKDFPTPITLSADNHTVEFMSDKADETTPHAVIYEDFMCPHCATLATEDMDAMAEAVAAGDLKVTVAPLGFMDQHRDPNNVTGTSHQALAASLAALHSGDSNLYWNLRAVVFKNQAKVHNTWNKEEFASAAEELGADKSVVEDIRAGKYLAEAAEMAKTNAKVLKDQTGEVSSPRVFINGTEVQPDPDWVQKYRRS